MIGGRHSTTASEVGSVRRIFVLGMMLLGLAVFCWGLHDKLSLYAPPTAPPPVAKAKLLSPDDQLTSLTRVAIPEAPSTVLPMLFLLLAALVFTPVARAIQPARRPMVLVRARSPQLRHRPPPPGFLR